MMTSARWELGYSMTMWEGVTCNLRGSWKEEEESTLGKIKDIFLDRWDAE